MGDFLSDCFPDVLLSSSSSSLIGASWVFFDAAASFDEMGEPCADDLCLKSNTSFSYIHHIHIIAEDLKLDTLRRVLTLLKPFLMLALFDPSSKKS
eukprot:767628-Hanusia_phi.AAC.1